MRLRGVPLDHLSFAQVRQFLDDLITLRELPWSTVDVYFSAYFDQNLVVNEGHDPESCLNQLIQRHLLGNQGDDDGPVPELVGS